MKGPTEILRFAAVRGSTLREELVRLQKKVSRRDELQAQLYNIDTDPSEHNDVLNERSEIAKQLADLLEKQRNSGRTR